MLTVPLFTPIVVDLGYDPIWFGVIFCLNMQIGYISPPFAPSAFYLKGVVSQDITLNEIFLSTMPYIPLIVIALLLVTFFPEIALWLPRIVK
jgi:TRAP-type mannitol/chloroaromatic compound transport system permease large subunit